MSLSLSSMPRPSSLFTLLRNGTLHMFRKHFLLTNMCISGSLSAVADCIEQHYEKFKEPERKYDLRRTCNMTAAGLTTGIVCHYWYIWLDNITLRGSPFKIAVKKMLLDQLINSPVTIVTFFATLAVMEGISLWDLRQELRCKSGKIYLLEWVLWPPLQLINFFWLPLNYRVLYVNSISMFEDVFVSYIKHETPADCEASQKREAEVLN
ncbi:unnamed protein product [Orchesella dallaii]|uniref:Mpv17-like protein 2 n=1 Tax=Orchesella dallaii TaxID=48710 RepID=A0ABP1RQI7_9HEXA